MDAAANPAAFFFLASVTPQMTNDLPELPVVLVLARG